MVSTKITAEQVKNLLSKEAAIEQINNSAKLANWAKSLNTNPADLRLVLVEYFGNRVEFKRGRNGGIYWVESTTEGA